MTVAQLIAALASADPNATVVIGSDYNEYGSHVKPVLNHTVTAEEGNPVVVLMMADEAVEIV